MKTVAKIFAVIVALILCAPFGFMGCLAHRARSNVKAIQVKLAGEWAALEPRVQSDTERWRDDPLLQARDGGDAAPLIYRHIRWESDKTSAPPMPEALAERIASFDGGWAEHADELDVRRIDTGWMADLGSAGYLNLEGPDTPLVHAPYVPFSSDLPNFIDLQKLVKVHLVQGLQAKDARRAARDVREVARLCMTTESLVGAMIGVSILSIERRARDEAARRGEDLAGWTAVSKEDQDSLRRLLWATPAPYALAATGPLAATTPAVGRCIGLQESIALAHYLRPYLEDELPERYTSLTRAIETSGCRLRRARAAWQSNDPAGQLATNGRALCQQSPGQPAEVCDAPAWSSHLPFFRPFIGDTLVAIAVPDWFKKYNQKD